MKKAVSLAVALMLTLTPAAALAAQTSASADYAGLYANALSLASSIDESVNTLYEYEPDSAAISLYEQVSPIVAMLNDGELNMGAGVVNLRDPQAISVAVGPVEKEIVSKEQVVEAAGAMLKVFINVLEPVDEQLKSEALDALPVDIDTITGRAERYGKEASAVIDDIAALVGENDFSKAMTQENIGRIFEMFISGQATPDAIISLAFDIINNTPGLGGEAAVEAGLLAARASSVFKRIEELYADVREWYDKNPQEAQKQLKQPLETFLSSLKYTVDKAISEATGRLLSEISS